MDSIRVQDGENIFALKKSSNSNDKITIKKAGNNPVKTMNSPLNLFKTKQVSSQREPRMEDMSMMSNPEKIHEEEDDDDAVSEAGTEMSDMSNEDGEEYENMSESGQEEDIEPAEGYTTIDEEKQDLLYKLHRASKKGIPVNKKLGAYSDVRELRAEVHKIRKDATVDAGLKMSKKVLMAVVGGMEFLNNRYDPFDVDLDGWSESVMLNVGEGDYDNCLERLCEKYSGRGDAPPEVELLLTLAGSAMMFHITNSMFKKGLNNNPQTAPQEMPTMPTMPTMSASTPSAPPMPQMQQMPQTPMDANSMRGPSLDLSNMMGSIGGRFPPMPMMSEPRKKLDEISLSSDDNDTEDVGNMETASVFSDSASEISSKAVSITQSKSSRRSRGRRGKEIDPSKVISL